MLPINVDNFANGVYNAMLSKDIYFRPCKDADNQYRHACHMCGTTLEWAYMENRLYAIRCNKCKAVTLIKEQNAAEASSIVGYEDEVPEDEDGR